MSTSPLNATFLSPTIQNNIISCIESVISRQLVRPVKDFYSIIVDGSSDVSRTEQLSINIRYVDEEGEIQERFLGFVSLEEQDAAAVVDAIDRKLEQLQLSKDYLVAQGYDGAAVMSGTDNGVQARIRRTAPNAVYVHCFSHCANLTGRSGVDNKKGIREVRAVHATISSASNYFVHSSVRTKKFEKIVERIEVFTTIPI